MESIDSLAKAINNFSGGLVLVSHDMRLISQVAREIWMCDNRTVTKYGGEINDFKMRIRRQMQRDNLIDADKAAVVSLKAVAAPKTVELAPAAPLVAPAVKESEEEMIRRTRLELAEIAIAKQRARQAAGGGAVEEEQKSSKVDDDEEAARKALLKAKKKAEKEAIAAREKLEEEERQQRREEKLRDIEVFDVDDA